jgi:hypothetical protein
MRGIDVLRPRYVEWKTRIDEPDQEVLQGTCDTNWESKLWGSELLIGDDNRLLGFLWIQHCGLRSAGAAVAYVHGCTSKSPLKLLILQDSSLNLDTSGPNLARRTPLTTTSRECTPRSSAHTRSSKRHDNFRDDGALGLGHELKG